MEETNKHQATQYILFKFIEWYKDVTKLTESNDLSILKTLKLIFLLCTVNNDKDQENLLDLYYNDFVAMPLGPVELSTYNFFLQSNFIDKKTLNKELIEEYRNMNFDNKNIIDDCIEKLKAENKNLIKCSASQLVDLTHKYSCWINNYNKGKESNSLREPILNDEIKGDEKFYYI